MNPENSDLSPLVSVIIPCFNHGNYLARAIRSIVEQSYQSKEIIVVDDGSTDDTCEVAKSFTGVIYVRQTNAGLSSARNSGMKHASGAYLIFADADDVMLPGAIALQVNYLSQDPSLAFVSGGHIKVDNKLDTLENVAIVVNDNHYKHLLSGNYIGMHGAVIYRRDVLENIKFDTSLKAAEDYDVYLRIARQFKVAHHETALALYRQHDENMSGNHSLMLDSVLIVLAKQKTYLDSRELKAAYRYGHRIWKEYYCSKILLLLRAHSGSISSSLAKQFRKSLWMYRPDLYIRFFISKILSHQKF